MSKNSQNKVYYEIGVVDQSTNNIIAEYLTPVRIVKDNGIDGIVHEKLMNLMYKNHGKNIVVLWNRKNGKLPDDHHPVIKIHIPKEPKLKYNR